MDKTPISNDIKSHVKNTNVWLRLLFMLMFTIIYSAAEFVIAIAVIFQFLTVLFTGKKNEKILSFGAQLSTYAYQIFRFLTFNSEEKPFPMAGWPSDEHLSVRKEAVKPKRAPRKRTTTKKATVQPNESDTKADVS